MKNKNRRPNLYIIAGPNGAGKTTFARKFLPQYVVCVSEFIHYYRMKPAGSWLLISIKKPGALKNQPKDPRGLKTELESLIAFNKIRAATVRTEKIVIFNHIVQSSMWRKMPGAERLSIAIEEKTPQKKPNS